MCAKKIIFKILLHVVAKMIYILEVLLSIKIMLPKNNDNKQVFV